MKRSGKEKRRGKNDQGKIERRKQETNREVDEKVKVELSGQSG